MATSFGTLFPSRMPENASPLEFSTLKDLIDYIYGEIKKTDLENQRVKFSADVVKIKDHNGSRYITVSQEVPSGENFELTVIVWQSNVRLVSRTLASFGVRSWNDLLGRKWEFQGTLRFYNRRAQFSFYADAIVPQGESDIIKRRERIKQLLKKKGLLMEVLHDLTELEPIRMIALITSGSAQGFFDFNSNLLLPDAYRPIVHLYQSTMQGPSTAREVIEALDRVESFCRAYNVKYDVIAIVRGGGGPSDLMHFDDYELAERIALMNGYIPVLTGIGHEKDETIPDFVAWRRFPTPTAVAKEIVNQIRSFIDTLDRKRQEFRQEADKVFSVASTLVDKNEWGFIKSFMTRRFDELDGRLDEAAKTMYRAFSLRDYDTMLGLDLPKNLSRTLGERIGLLARQLGEAGIFLKRNVETSLSQVESTLRPYDSMRSTVQAGLAAGETALNELFESLAKSGGVLASLLYGGSVVLKDGRFVTSAQGLVPGDSVELRFVDGTAVAAVREVETVAELYGKRTSTVE